MLYLERKIGRLERVKVRVVALRTQGPEEFGRPTRFGLAKLKNENPNENSELFKCDCLTAGNPIKRFDQNGFNDAAK